MLTQLTYLWNYVTNVFRYIKDKFTGEHLIYLLVPKDLMRQLEMHEIWVLLIIFSIVAPFAGNLLKSWSERQILLFGFTVISIGYLGTAFAPNIYTVFVSFSILVGKKALLTLCMTANIWQFPRCRFCKSLTIPSTKEIFF